jgi:hypothetical protein
MSRQLTETEIALFRFGYWPCCGERETMGIEREPLMRTLKCTRCGTIAKVPMFVTTTEMMKRLSTMIYHSPVNYDPPAVAMRLGMDEAQIKRANMLMNLAPHEARQQRRKLFWLSIMPETKWIAAVMSLTVLLTVLAVEYYPGSGLEPIHVGLRVLGGGMVLLFAGMSFLSWKRTKEKK